jgi:hypothetical protein
MRRWLPLVLYLGLALVAAAMALAGVGGAPRARAAVVAANGSFEISNSREGQPIFAASGIGPGDSARGTVAIEDTGSGPVALVLARGGLADVPGLGGGLLSSRLELTVADVSKPATPRTLYEGPLASMPDRPAGRLEAGEARTFEFTATLPDAGGSSFQNEVQGGATTVAYTWTATEAGEEEAEAPGESTPGGGGGVAPAGGGAAGDIPYVPAPPAGPGAEPSSSPLELAVTKVRRRVRAGRLLVWAGCDRSCRIEVHGRLRAVAGGRRRFGGARLAGRAAYRAGSQRLRIAIPRRLRHWALSQADPTRLRARLTFTARDPQGGHDALKRTLKLRLRLPR